MKTERYLEQIERLNCRIEFKVNELKNLREIALVVKSATTDDMKVQSGSPQNKMENICIEIVDKENELKELINHMINKKDQLVSEIEQLENINEYKVLIMRYVECRRMRDIADTLNYSVKNIERIRTKAIENFTLMYKDEKDLSC